MLARSEVRRVESASAGGLSDGVFRFDDAGQRPLGKTGLGVWHFMGAVCSDSGNVAGDCYSFTLAAGKDAALNLDLIGPPDGIVEMAVAHERGPVLVSCEYQIEPHEAQHFMQAVQGDAARAATHWRDGLGSV